MNNFIETLGLKDLQAGLPFDCERMDNLPVALYMTDAEGKISYYNREAVRLWGRVPSINKERWCGSYGIYTLEGQYIPHKQCPMATTIRENTPVRGVEAMASRPDGTCYRFMPFPTPIRDENGNLVGAVNMLVYLGEASSLPEKPDVDFDLDD